MSTLDEPNASEATGEPRVVDVAKIRDVVRNASPEQRKALAWLFTSPQAKSEYVIRRLNEEGASRAR